MSKSLKRNLSDASDLSEDRWGPWGAKGHVGPLGNPTPVKVEEPQSYSDAQPRAWENWQDWDDAGTGGTHGSSWASSDWNAGNDWEEADASDDALVADIERQLEAEAESADEDEAEGNSSARLEKAKGLMAKRDVNKTAYLEDAIRSIAVGQKVPKGHAAMQMARKDDMYMQSEKTVDFLEDFFAAELERVVKKYVFTEAVEETEGVIKHFWSFDRIVREEGGRHNPENIKAAKRRCKK